MAKNNIVLIGMPGAGKSTLGVVLAKILGYDFVDGDILIQNEKGKTLQKIIDEVGPLGFIEVENDVLRKVEVEHCVIATGGSAVYSEQAMEHLGEIGIIVYLKVSLEELRARLGSLHERGVVMRDGTSMPLSAIYEERMPYYERYAEITLDCDGMVLRENVQKLVDVLSLG